MNYKVLGIIILILVVISFFRSREKMTNTKESSKVETTSDSLTDSKVEESIQNRKNFIDEINIMIKANPNDYLQKLEKLRRKPNGENIMLAVIPLLKNKLLMEYIKLTNTPIELQGDRFYIKVNDEKIYINRLGDLDYNYPVFEIVSGTKKTGAKITIENLDDFIKKGYYSIKYFDYDISGKSTFQDLLDGYLLGRSAKNNPEILDKINYNQNHNINVDDLIKCSKPSLWSLFF